MQNKSPCSTIPITKPKAIAVEGKDDQYFFDALLKHLGLKQIQVVPMEGKYPLTDKIEAVKNTSGFSGVISFGVAIDADRNYVATFQSVCGALRHSNLLVPTGPLKTAKAKGNPSITVIILPRKNTQGILEDLCLQAVKSDPALPCVNRYFKCLSKRGVTTNNISKAKVHAFLSSRKEPDLRLGEAAMAGCWPFGNPAFKEVKRFLNML
jgi:hypothetical protein